MQFHEEMRAHSHVEGLCHMRHLEPGGNAANATDIDLDDAGGIVLQIFAEVTDRIDALPHRNGQAGMLAEPDVPGHVVGR